MLHTRPAGVLRKLSGIVLALALVGSGSSALAQHAGTDTPSWKTPTTIFSTENQVFWRDIEALPDGKLLALGPHWRSDAVQAALLFRFDRNGRPDAKFGDDGVLAYPLPADFDRWAPSDILVDALGRIYLAGYYYAEEFLQYRQEGHAVIRLLPDGSLDTSYGTDGVARILLGTSSLPGSGTWAEQRFLSLPLGLTGVALQPDGAVVLLSHGLSLEGVFPSLVLVMRLDAQGQIDAGFGNTDEPGVSLLPLEPRGAAFDVEVASDGGLVLGGTYNYPYEGGPGNDYRGFVMKLTAEGSVDTSFGDAGLMSTPALHHAEDLALQDNGSIVVGGKRCASGVVDCEIMVFRLDSAGALDTGFGVDGYAYVDPTASSEAVKALALDANANILLAGDIYTGLPDGRYAPGFMPFFAGLSPAGELDFIRTDLAEPDGFAALALSVAEDAFLLIGQGGAAPLQFSILKFNLDRARRGRSDRGANGVGQ